jgi:hypothetical protein
LLDKDLFRQVYVTSRTIEWPNGADFAPEYLYKLAELTVEAEQSVLLQIPH